MVSQGFHSGWAGLDRQFGDRLDEADLHGAVELAQQLGGGAVDLDGVCRSCDSHE